MSAECAPLLVYVDQRHNSAKLSDRWFWEVLDENGRVLRVRLGDGIFPFGWARSEASAYRQARRRKWAVRAALAAHPVDSGAPRELAS